MKADVIVVGGGPAGMMAAGVAARSGLRVLLLEKNPRLGRKLMITGKGRCNVTNNCDVQDFLNHVPTNPRFLQSAIHRFTPQDAMAFFEELGVPLKTERGSRVFPVSDKAVDIVDAMVKFVRESGVNVQYETPVKALSCQDGAIAGVTLESGEMLEADAVVLATGGKSYPRTGSTGDGYHLAEQVGHTILPPRPSLIPIETQEDWCQRVQGLSLKNVTLSAVDAESGKIRYSELGEMLFTHFGVSGPLVLSLSAHLGDLSKRQYRLLIDLKPALDIQALDARLLRDFSELQNKDFGNSLEKLLPRKLIPIVISMSGIPSITKVNQITREQRRRLCELLKAVPLTVWRFRPIDEAVVTSGGVKVGEINPKTMESKLVKGLFFAGELIDVDAYTGGYNLQIAYSTGYAAGLGCQGGLS
ncbi:MAG: aminoacetone oxidase family FAD-binding enzyme [Clostridiales bacterium]|nr:MAG: aminoacetone oxidase family FAD-binding enzyme [Clostridiales bacterium]